MEEKKFSLFPKGIDENENPSYDLTLEKEGKKTQDNIKGVEIKNSSGAFVAEKEKSAEPILERKRPEKDSVYFHTMRTDAQKYVEEKDLSLINIFSKESKKASKKFEEEIKFKASFFVWLGIIALLFFITGFLGYKVFFGGKIKNEPQAVIPSPFIFSDQVKPIHLTDSNFDISGEISEKFKDSYSLNTFTYFPIIRNNGIISSEDFLKGLKINVPPELLKSLDKDLVFIIYADDKDANHIVLGMKLNSYERAFREMFEWENEMLEELQPIIISAKNDLTLRKSEFIDKVVSNIDARVLETSDGKPLITYGFFGRKYLLITDSKEALKKSIERLKISLSE